MSVGRSSGLGGRVACVRRCALCPSHKNVQGNHIGGRNHLGWITMPFCDKCHQRFHILARQAGLDLEYTSDPIERLRRALAFIKICEWMILEQMKNERSRERPSTK